MKKGISALARSLASVVSCLMFFNIAYAEVPADNLGAVHIKDPAAPLRAEDVPNRGYFAFNSQSMANFEYGNRSYSAPGVSLALMFHGKKRFKIPTDAGLEWSNFGSSNRGREFALNNLHLQAMLPFKFLYFKGGYGISNLHDKTARESLTGGCWKWGFGEKPRFFVNALYVNIETNRWDGPGPVGFRSQSFG